ncbi:hypothetical protein KKA95_05435 [Patescibacteria group bacterium]|nr:hypothetical protein [Patescibacteria group bacterium]
MKRKKKSLGGQKFSDRVREQLRNKGKPVQTKKIEFACRNCLTIFMFEFTDVCFDAVRELHFTPEAECPKCGSTDEISFTDYGQERIEDMIFSNLIRTRK